MAGLCGCWRVGSSASNSCDGCGYKILLRGALATSSRPPLPQRGVNNNQSFLKPPIPPRNKKDKKDASLKRESSENREEKPRFSHHRRHSHPVRSPPEPPPASHLPRSLQRRRLPESSAYNVPLPPSSPHTLVSLVPYWDGTKEALGMKAYANPHQPLLLSTIQPPPELCPPTPLPPSPHDRVPPFDLSSFLPPPTQVTPPLTPTSTLPGLFTGVSASTSLQVRYRALSLARAACTTRSHTDLRQNHDVSHAHHQANDQQNSEYLSTNYNITEFRPPEFQPLNIRGSAPVTPNLFTSKTLPAPPPPQQQKKYCVRPPQHVDQEQNQEGLEKNPNKSEINSTKAPQYRFNEQRRARQSKHEDEFKKAFAQLTQQDHQHKYIMEQLRKHQQLQQRQLSRQNSQDDRSRHKESRSRHRRHHRHKHDDQQDENQEKNIESTSNSYPLAESFPSYSLTPQDTQKRHQGQSVVLHNEKLPHNIPNCNQSLHSTYQVSSQTQENGKSESSRPTIAQSIDSQQHGDYSLPVASPRQSHTRSPGSFRKPPPPPRDYRHRQSSPHSRQHSRKHPKHRDSINSLEVS